MTITEMTRASAASLSLSEYFHGGDSPQPFLVNQITAIGVQEPVSVCVGVQVEPQRPQRPEHVDVPVADAGAIQVHESAESPIVQNNVRQTVVPVQQHIGMQA